MTETGNIIAFIGLHCGRDNIFNQLCKLNKNTSQTCMKSKVVKDYKVYIMTAS